MDPQMTSLHTFFRRYDQKVTRYMRKTFLLRHECAQSVTRVGEAEKLCRGERTQRYVKVGSRARTKYFFRATTHTAVGK
jgi:hypothetical protein